MPNASGNVLGTTSASQAGSRSASSSCSSRPVNTTRSRMPAARREVAPSGLALQPVEEREQVPQRAARAALGAAALLGDLAHRLEVAVGQRGGHPHRRGVPGAEADHDQARVGQPLRARAARRRAAGRRPWRRSACRRTARCGPRRVAAASSARAAAAVSRLKDVAVRRAGGRAGEARRRAAAGPPPRRPARGRGSASTSTPGRAEARPRGQRGVVERRPQALGGVPRADEHRARAASRPSRAYGRKRGCGLTVYSSALPWTFDRVGHRAVERAGEDRPGPSRGGWPARRPARRARRPRAPPRRSRRGSASSSASLSSGNGRASMPS